MTGTVYSYLRFSDPRQAAGSSAERQQQYAARWAAERGLTLDDTLTLRDEGLSAYHQRHVKTGALGVFLQAIDDGRIAPGSVLVVEGLDRLSRAEPIQAQAQLAQIINAGVTVVTASDGKEYNRERLKSNPMDLVYSLLVMIRAHEESDTKSKRVTQAIRRQCEGWIAGAYRGPIRSGKDPAWLRWTAAGWEPIPDRVEAARLALDLFRRGYGATRIARELADRKLSITGGGPAALQVYRLIRQRGLLGEKEVKVGGEEYRLPDYYPALITLDEWSELQGIADARGKKRVKGDIPGIITGMGITVCGYCGAGLIGQNLLYRRRKSDGGLADGHRRLQCVSTARGAGCTVPGSCSVAPVERALIAYCADGFNLASLFDGGDAAAPVRAELARLSESITTTERQVERITAAMLADDEAAPIAFARKARELEAQLARERARAEQLERELSALARRDRPGMSQAWAGLEARALALDYEARMQTRRLVADTFARIVVYHSGVDPTSGTIDLLLAARGGATRLLRIDRTTGQWRAAEDFHAPATAPHQ